MQDFSYLQLSPNNKSKQRFELLKSVNFRCEKCSSPLVKKKYKVVEGKVICNDCYDFLFKRVVTRKQVAEEIINEENKTLEDVGKKLGITRERVRQLAVKLGIDTKTIFKNRRDEAREVIIHTLICNQCNVSFTSTNSRKIFCSPECYSKYLSGQTKVEGIKRLSKVYPCERNRKTPSKVNRTKVVRVGGESKQVLAHRVIMEQHLGRKLSKGEQVVHLNNDNMDNRIENLVVMTATERYAYQTMFGYAPKFGGFTPKLVKSEVVKKHLLAEK